MFDLFRGRSAPEVIAYHDEINGGREPAIARLPFGEGGHLQFLHDVPVVDRRNVDIVFLSRGH